MTKYLLISILFILVSCTGDQESGFERRVVVNAIISTQAIWDVDLSYTKERLDLNPIQRIEDATIKVRNLTNGQVFDLDDKGNGQYVYHLEPIEGHNYEIEVITPDNEVVTASTYVPRVLNVEYSVVDSEIDGKGEQYKEINITIEDDPNNTDYYIWEIVEIDQNSVIGTSTITSEVTDSIPDGPTPSFESNNPGFPFIHDDPNLGKLTKNLNDPVIISDADINGTLEAKIIVNKKELLGFGSNGIHTVNLNEKPRYKLAVMAVSEELYNRVLSMSRQEAGQGSTSHDRNVFVYSNILPQATGAGIFGGYNLKEYPITY